MMKANEMSELIRHFIKQVPVIPVLEVGDVDAAVPLAEALVNGGLHVLEVTLRTPAALEVISKMTQVEGAIIAAGTILNSTDMHNAKQAGARFAVSPGITESLFNASEELGFPLMPGVATASEVMQACNRGFSFLKFFPAEISGGVTALKSFSGPFKNLKFCPTGGINIDKASDYLSLPNVDCVGGSWVATRALIENKDWKSIERLSKKSAALSSKENR